MAKDKSKKTDFSEYVERYFDCGWFEKVGKEWQGCEAPELEQEPSSGELTRNVLRDVTRTGAPY